MSEGRAGGEVNMDEYMKVVDYDPNGDRVVENALNATNCNFAQKASDASNLGSRSAADYATKNDLKGFQDTVSAVQTTANNAQASATQAQGTATNAAVTAVEAKCMAAEAQTTASEVKVALAGKVDTDDGKGLSTEDYTTQEKAKLAGIEAGANNYVHPETHSASMIEGLPEVVQGTGPSTTAVMSQNAVTTVLNGKVATVNGQGPDVNGNVGVIESGKNENGRYIKFADGTLICTNIFEISSLDITTPQGGAYYAKSFEISPFAHEFLGDYAIHGSAFADEATLLIGFFRRNGTVWNNIFRFTSLTVHNVTVTVTAIGRWK